MMGRTPCCDKEGLKKGPWTPEEDQKLVNYIQMHGAGNWRTFPKKAGLQRCGKSCRLRWTNYLRPDIKRGGFSFEEEETIIQLHSILGNKWSAIAAKLPGRTDNEIKNYWNTHIRKRLLRMGIDPVTHGPRLDLMDLPSILSSLQNPSLLNMPALLNLQTLLNPEPLKLATSLTCSQIGIPSSLAQNFPQHHSQGNPLAQNPTEPNVQIAKQIKPSTQYIPSFDGTDVKPNSEQNPSSSSNFKAVQTNLPVNGHVIAEPSFYSHALDHVTLYQSNNSASMSNNSNQSFSGCSFSSGFSTPCSSPVDPFNSSLAHLISGTISEDELESYFGNTVKLESAANLDVCS